MDTKKFSLATVLTVTTGRLLTSPKNGGNGIEDLYEILGWMTNDSPFTHQLGRFAEECKPWLLKWFPELAPASVSMDSLDKWLKADQTGTAQEGIKMWLTELKMMFPEIKDEYEIGRIPSDCHSNKGPITELAEMMGKSE